MSSSAGGERPDVLAHILRTTARLTLTPAKLAAVLAGAFRALPLLNTPSRAMQSTRSKFVQSCRFHARVPCLINLEVPYPFTPANTPLGHCPSPLEQWPHQLANRVRPSSRSTVNPTDLPSPSGAAAQRDPRCAQTAAHCTHTGCPLHSHRLPTGLTQVARCAHTAAHCTHTGCPLVSPRLPTGLTQVAHWTHPGCPLDSPRLPELVEDLQNDRVACLTHSLHMHARHHPRCH